MVTAMVMEVPLPLPRKLPQFGIDHSKCTVPFWCKKCLEVCPTAVFQVHVQHEKRLLEEDPRLPGTYRLFAVRRDRCTGCDKCVEVCPVNALKLTLP